MKNEIHDDFLRTIVLSTRSKKVADLIKCLSVFPNSDVIKDVNYLKFTKVGKRPFSSSEIVKSQLQQRLF